MKRKPAIIVHDWETTGLVKHPRALARSQPRAIEFGAVVLDADGEIVSEHSFLINPQCRIEPIITKITGLTDDDLAAEPTFSEIFPTIRDLFSSCRAVVAHNLPFDEQIYRSECERLGVEFERSGFPEIRMCSAQEFRETSGRNPPKLLDLYARIMGKPLEQTHRALDDVKALVEIIQKEKLACYLS